MNGSNSSQRKNKAIKYMKILEEYDQADSLYDMPLYGNYPRPQQAELLDDSAEICTTLEKKEPNADRPWYQAIVSEAWDAVEKSIEASDQVLSNVYQSVEALGQTEKTEDQIVTSSTTTNVVTPEGTKRVKASTPARPRRKPSGPPSPENRQPEYDPYSAPNSNRRIDPDETTEIHMEKKDREAKKRAEIAKRRGMMSDSGSANTGPRTKVTPDERKEPGAKRSSTATGPKLKSIVGGDPKDPIAKTCDASERTGPRMKTNQVSLVEKQQPSAKKLEDSTRPRTKTTVVTPEERRHPTAKKCDDSARTGPRTRTTVVSPEERKHPSAKKLDSSVRSGPKARTKPVAPEETKQPEAKTSNVSTRSGPRIRKTAISIEQRKQPVAKKSHAGAKEGPKARKMPPVPKDPGARKEVGSNRTGPKSKKNLDAYPSALAERKDPPGSRRRYVNAEAASDGDQPKSIVRYDLEDDNKKTLNRWGMLATGDGFIPKCPGDRKNAPLRPCDIPRGSELRQPEEESGLLHTVEDFFSKALNPFST